MAKDIKEIPGLEPKPIIGWVGNVGSVFSDPMVSLTNLREKFGDVFSISRGGNPHIFFSGKGKHQTLFVFGSKYNHQIMSDAETFYSGSIVGALLPDETATGRQAILRRLSIGLFGLNGNEHRRQRRLVMPAFHKQRLEFYYQDIVRITDEKIDQWKIGEQRDIWREMMDLTLQVVGQCLFGLNVLKEGRAFGETIQKWIKLAVSAETLLLQADIPGLPYHRFLNLSTQLDETVRGMIAENRASKIEKPDVLSLLMSSKNEDGTPAFTDDEVISHSAIFFIAGHETSSNALSWIFFLLSQHPQVMKKLRLEIDRVIGSAPPTIAQLKEMTYLDAIVKESLRLMPPAPLSARLVAKPVELGGYNLPIGTEVTFSAFHTHHDPAIYENPHQFIPERWETINPTAYEYIPFSTGIRSCIGMPLALMEIPIIIARVVQRFHLQLTPNANITPHIGLTMSPKYGLPMIIHAKDDKHTDEVKHVKGTIQSYIDLKPI
ncbi:MAG: cytochrome P450 [Chloroflexi bacterium OLB14]|nr:MAG: cytochrome P450 [Chloroflexi bacterium OLB14]